MQKIPIQFTITKNSQNQKTNTNTNNTKKHYSQILSLKKSNLQQIPFLQKPLEKMLENPELINFLKKQNTSLRQEVKQLKELLTFNRQAMRVSIEFKNGNQKALPPLVKLLYQENTKLLTKLNQMKLELEKGLCKALVSQQIAFASTEHQKYMTNQLKSKLVKLKKELEIRDNKIIDLQKNRLTDQNNTQIKIVEIAQPNIQNMKLKNDIDLLHEEIQLKNQDIQKLKQTKQQLIRLNLILSKQISELKALSLLESTKSKEIDSKPMNSGQISRFLNYQKKIIDGDHDENYGSNQDSQKQSELNQNQSSFDEEMAEDFQEDHQNHNKTFTHNQHHPKNQLSKLNLTKMGEISKLGGTGGLGMTKIPKLQLSKAKEIQQLIVKKINNDQKKKNGGNVKQQKYKKLQNQITQIRKKMGKTLIQKLNQQRQNNFLRKIVKQLQQRNIMLTQQRMMTQAQVQYMKRYEKGQETLIDMCRDVTMNDKLREVLQGRQELFCKKGLISNQV